MFQVGAAEIAKVLLKTAVFACLTANFIVQAGQRCRPMMAESGTQFLSTMSPAPWHGVILASMNCTRCQTCGQWRSHSTGDDMCCQDLDCLK